VIIAITGTPGTGKTATAKRLARLLNFNCVGLNKLIKQKKLYSSFDKKRKSYVVDVKKFNKLKIKDDSIVDSHLSHFLKSVNVIFVLRCAPSALEKRLAKKKWNKDKIQENVEAELIGIVASEARQMHKKVYDIDTTRKNPSAVALLIAKVVKGSVKGNGKIIDWIK